MFGLGGSGLASARALVAGGADVDRLGRRRDDARQRRERGGLPTADLRELDWSRDRRAGARARRAADPSGAALAVALGARGRRRGHRRHRAVLPRAARSRRRDAPFVAITGTNGKSTTTALIAHLLRQRRLRRAARRQYRHADPALEPPRAGRVHVIEMLVLPDRSCALARSVGRHSAQRHARTISTGTARMENYAAVKERLVAGVQPSGTAIVGVDDEWCPAIADRHRARGQARGARSRCQRRCATAIYVEDGARSCARTAAARDAVARPRRHRLAARRAQCAERGLRAAPRSALGLDCRRSSRRACARFPGLPTAWRRSAASGSVLFVNDSKATNADAAAKALACFDDIFWIAGGKPKTGGIDSLRRFFPRIRKAYLIGEAAADFAATLDGKVPFEIAAARSTAPSTRPRAMPRRRALTEPVVLLSPACASFDQFRQFRGARRRASAISSLRKLSAWRRKR